MNTRVEEKRDKKRKKKHKHKKHKSSKHHDGMSTEDLMSSSVDEVET